MQSNELLYKNHKVSLSLVANPYLMILMSAMFLFYKYILIVFPSVMAQELMITYHINGVELGNLAASYFYSYIIIQIFAGMLLDKFSLRALTTSALLLCAISVFCFSCAKSFIAAELARIFMGVGASFATLSYLKLAATWFTSRPYAFLAGLLASAAMIGALFGSTILAGLVAKIGWEKTLLDMAYLGLLIAAVYWFIVRDKSQINSSKATINSSLINLYSVFKNKRNIFLSLFCGLVFSPIEIFTGLWGIPFLKQTYHFNNTEAGLYMSFAFIGLAIGSPLISLCAEYINNRILAMQAGTVLALVCLVMILYCPQLSNFSLFILFFSFGFGTGCFMLGFTLARDVNSLALIATAISVINSFEAMWSAFSDPLIGKLLDLGWEGEIINQAHVFSAHTYRVALSMLPCYLIMGLLLIFPIKKYCVLKNLHSEDF